MLSRKEATIRILLSIILGGIVGFEREKVGKPAGLRTHILVCMGSTMTMLVSLFMFYQFQGKTNLDPARISAQVISGIGFLGAGTIILEGPTVKGLTTAATLWVVATIGLTIGIGFYYIAILSTAIIFLVLGTFSKFENIILKKHRAKTLVIVFKNSSSSLSKVASILKGINISLNETQLDFSEDSSVTLSIKLPKINSKLEKNIIEELLYINDVEYVTLQNSSKYEN
ncbi:magnesium transporter MgtC [Tepidanaerobacter syntrophicus]|uniref:MgtC/SapB family protein n=1 Tax=Tepidanaerobacter syntrophicus TaxID=224999 RepID=UPI001BD54FED|nr:MgtC/SapB family protein [Tepidanaerobacter syntrophicus]GLI50743.1 magnesium transporter MgtC [Tepidanaerobacter syntrophicus]